eukprot:COSAG06_NODE_63075_length_263_cov_0.634146_1_plen_36_part_01
MGVDVLDSRTLELSSSMECTAAVRMQFYIKTIICQD